MWRKVGILIVLAYTLIIYSNAQQTFNGVVTDAGGQPLDAAVVQLLTLGGRIAGYTLTDSKGGFTITTRHDADSLNISVSLLGYKTYRQKVNSVRFNIKLEQEVFTLREVEVKAGRVWGRSDTVNYDVSQFLSAKDESIKDVIKKLPGIDVSDVGRISYNGKEISNFYVEGLDLVGGRYNQITNNLDAKAVEAVQVLENHQPVRMLKDKIKSEEVALNLKLKAEFRDKWMVVLQGGLGLPPVLWDVMGNAFQLSRKSQSAYSYKSNNAGKDITDEQVMFFKNTAGMIREVEASSFLSQPSITAPLKKERLLFNDMHTLSGNRIYKLGENSRLRINAGFTHDERSQKRGSQTLYFQQSDTVDIAEQSNMRLRSDMAELMLDFENNANDKFMTDRFKLSGTWEDSRSDYQGLQSLQQRIKTQGLTLRNELNSLWNVSDYTLEARSLLRYSSLPSELLVSGLRLENLPFNMLYADHSFAFLRKKGSLTQRYTGGVNFQLSNLANGYSPYIVPSYQLGKSLWYASLTMPLVYTTFSGRDFSRFSANPSLGLQYKPHYAWQFRAYASYRENYGDVTSFAPSRHEDYRTVVDPNGILPVNRQQNYSMSGEYKRTVYEFFSSLSIGYSRLHSNYILEETFEQGQRRLSYLEQSRNTSGWNLQGMLSKGFYDYGVKFSLNYLLGNSDGEQINAGKRLPYHSEYMQYEPKVSWNPFRRLETSYQATLRYGGSKVGSSQLTPLCNLVQKLQISYEYGGIEYNLSGDHYYNDISNSQSVHAFFADFSARWKPGKWQFEASATNLFDKRQYSYTQYSSTQSYTSWIDIRGREFMLSAKYRF